MKLSEVIAILEKNPNKKFISKEGTPGEMIAKSDCEIITISYRDPGYGGVTNFHLNRKWKEVKEPVDFITAVKSGKRIRHEMWCDFYELNEMFDEMSLINDNSNRRTILGKWYIED